MPKKEELPQSVDVWESKWSNLTFRALQCLSTSLRQPQVRHDIALVAFPEAIMSFLASSDLGERLGTGASLHPVIIADSPYNKSRRCQHSHSRYRSITLEITPASLPRSLNSPNAVHPALETTMSRSFIVSSVVCEKGTRCSARARYLCHEVFLL